MSQKEETDKFKKDAGRRAFQKESESKFLNQESLNQDLVQPKELEIDPDIVDSKHSENQEWHAREKQNEKPNQDRV